MKPLGLIAGEGVFPILVARGARAAGRKVVCVGLHGNYWPELRLECDHFQEAGILRFGKWIHILRSQGCEEAIIVGRVRKSLMYDRWRYFRYIPDWRTVKLWFGRLRHDKRPRAVMEAMADELAKAGIKLVDSTQYCKDHMCTLGVLTRRQPTPAQWIDIRFGWDICRTISQLDIGQALAVINKDVIAVEALEGTNLMIERAGGLCKSGGWTMIKVANGPGDMRLDVPSVGTTTIEKLHAAKAGCLVLEAGKTMLLEKTKTLELADRYKMIIVGYDPAHPEIIPVEARTEEGPKR
jgi:UDP-2,3-diacylglucosamine hydrolase